jgi:hypothetical protein
MDAKCMTEERASERKTTVGIALARRPDLGG